MTKNSLYYFIENIPKDKLLAPIIYNNNILESTKQCDNIISSLPDNNKVKIFLRKELKNIIINKVKLGKKYEDILKELSIIENYQDKKENNYNNSFVFKNTKVFLKSKCQGLGQKMISDKKNQKEGDKLAFRDIYRQPPWLNKTTEDIIIGMNGRS